MTTRDTAKRGDAVIVYDGHGPAGAPRPGDEGTPGTIVKAGPKNVVIALDDQPDGIPYTFSRATGRSTAPAAVSSGQYVFRTSDEDTTIRRRDTAVGRLAALGITLTSQCTLTTSQLENIYTAAAGDGGADKNGELRAAL